MLTIGNLRHRINFQELTLTADGQGGHTSTWTTVLTVWAKIERSGGAERLFSQRLEATYDHKIYIRNLSGITESMRIEYEGRFFQLKSIEREEERRWWTKILAKEGVPS